MSLVDFYDFQILCAEFLESRHGHERTFINRYEAGKKPGGSSIYALSIGEIAGFNGAILFILWSS